MSRAAKGWCLTWLAILTACGSAGTDPGVPQALPHGGTGEFRPLTEEETGISASDGRVLVNRGAMDTLFVHGRHLFYGGGALLSDAVDPPPEAVPSVVDWTSFEPREIFRAAPFGMQAFGEPLVVFSAEQPWEAATVTDPWLLESSPGQLRLYYVGGVESADQGGVGVAMATSVDGVFSRLTTTPALGRIDGVLPRRPSVVQFGGEFLMYVSLGNAIHLARSSDGTTFTPMGPVSLGDDLFDLPSSEVGIGDPGAVTVITGTGRDLVRLYFVSHREDGSTALALAASLDGMNFERFERPVTAQTTARSPAPLLVDDRITLLYTVGSRISQERELGVAQGLVTPAGTDLAPEGE